MRMKKLDQLKENYLSNLFFMSRGIRHCIFNVFEITHYKLKCLSFILIFNYFSILKFDMDRSCRTLVYDVDTVTFC